MIVYQALIVEKPEDTPVVEVSEKLLHQILTCIADLIIVDADWYISKYADVRDAIRQGMVESAKEHYVSYGYFENRMPRLILVDESFYFREYPDVSEAIRLGHVQSAQSHFELYGFKEGRLPCKEWQL